MKDSTSTQTPASSLMQRLERLINDEGHAMLGNCEGRVIAPDSGGLNFRLLHGGNRSGETFASYLALFDGMTAPVALAWPMRQSGGIADGTTQSRYLAIMVRLATGERWAILDRNKRLEWYPGTSPRVAEMRRCLKEFRPEEGGDA